MFFYNVRESEPGVILCQRAEQGSLPRAEQESLLTERQTRRPNRQGFGSAWKACLQLQGQDDRTGKVFFAFFLFILKVKNKKTSENSHHCQFFTWSFFDDLWSGLPKTIIPIAVKDYPANSVTPLRFKINKSFSKVKGQLTDMTTCWVLWYSIFVLVPVHWYPYGRWHGCPFLVYFFFSSNLMQ